MSRAPASATAAALPARLFAMLAGWGTVGLCYSVGQLAPGTAHVLRESALDRAVPFDVSAVWFYLSFFAFVPLAYLGTTLPRLSRLTRAMQLSAVAAALVFVGWPTTLVYPAVSASGASGATLHLLAAFDSAKNCLPSLHGALTLLGVLALWQRERPWRSALVLLWGLAIMASVIATRRHLAIDLGTGVALGAACWLLAAPASPASRTAHPAGAAAGLTPPRSRPAALARTEEPRS